VIQLRQLPLQIFLFNTSRWAIVPRGFFIPQIKKRHKIFLFGEGYGEIARATFLQQCGSRRRMPEHNQTCFLDLEEINE